MPKVMHTGQWEGLMLFMRAQGQRSAKRIGVSVHCPHSAPWDSQLPCPGCLWVIFTSSRDLKPTNILLGDEGQPVLMDLGSMNQACIQVEGSRQALALQDWAAQRCTISYRAPELFSVQSHCVIDERTDVWSLGCVLYAMMFGEGPYDMVFQKGDSVALAVQNELNIPQSSRHSSALRQLLASMMTVDPQQRPRIPIILSQLEALQPPAPGQHTTQI